ncbi:FLYWCH-type zinc finger-containing protein 1-like [Aedes albopictus]|uniref:FLYWCH-type domain-containing protein n=1 Tax=Aedes albopictus TaxID=7160 RepID=A0ABM1YW78_AEDAL
MFLSSTAFKFSSKMQSFAINFCVVLFVYHARLTKQKMFISDPLNPAHNRLLFIVGQRGRKLVFDGFSFHIDRHRNEYIYWRCSKHSSLGCRARLKTTNKDFKQYFSELTPTATKKPTVITLDNQELDFVPGQRGTSLLRINNYCYAKNNKSQNSTYWVCRTRVQHRPCNARVVTTLKSNGLYRILITNPVHIHEPNKYSAYRSVGQVKRRPKLVAPKPVLEEIFTFTFDSD